MIWDIREQKTTNQYKKKRESKKKQGQCKQPPGLQAIQHSHHRVQKEKRKSKKYGNLFEKTMKENFPNFVKEIDMQVQEAQSPKQDGCKEAHSKTHN